MISCAGCSFLNEKTSRFCGRCGASLSMHREKGFVIGERFRIDSVMEGGGGGWIYRGTDLVRSRPVRIREITPHPEAPFAPADRIIRAAAPLYKLQGGVAGTLIDLVISEDSIILVYESGNGTPLNPSAVADRESPAFVAQAIRWLNEGIGIMEYLHEFSPPVVFGTLKPSSFEINDRNNLILADPGFACLMNLPGDLVKYCRPGFLAPEVFTLGALFPESDYFSLAAVFHHLFTGRNPEEKRGDPFRFASVRRLNAAASPELDQVIDSMLKEDYRSRGKNPVRLMKKLRLALGEPGPADQNILRGIAFHNQGKYDAAAVEFERAGLMDPEDPTPFFWRGMTYAAAGDAKKAIIYYNKTLELDPDYQSAFCQRGSIRTNQEDFVGAVGDFSRAIVLDKKDSRAYFGRASAHRQMGRPDLAIDDLKKAVSLDPAFAAAHLWLGLITFEQGNISDALKYYEKAIASDPEDPYSFVARGTARAEIEDMDGALSDFNRAVALHDGYGAAYMERGLLLARMDQPEKAMKDLSESIRLDPESPEAFFHRGRIRYMVGDYRGAIEDLTGFISEIPDDPEAYRLRGQAFRCIGDFERGNRDSRVYKTLKNRKDPMR